MPVDYTMLRKGTASLGDFQRLQEEFELEKQRQIASTTGQDPAALKLANEYEAAIKSGDTDRANRIAAFSKIYDKNVMQTSDGQYVPLPGLPQALGSLEFGKESGTQQAKDIYEPGRAGAVEGAKLQQQLGYEPQIKRAVKSAESSAEKQSELNERVASMPQLEATVRRLTDLGRVATYTKTGQLVDVVRRETGMEPREAAIARKEYISLVDNQVLPLLRQTFGAQFTQKEGESLKVTLGDPNATPEEKEAVLRSFIQQKQATIETMRRQMGQAPEQRQTTNPATNTPYDQIQPDMLMENEFQNTKKPRLKYNPVTGEFE